MKIFQNRFVAVLIALLVIIGSTLIAGRANLSKACRAQEESFFTVSEGKAPVYYVDQLISASASLADLAEKYDVYADQAVTIRQARRDLVKAEESRDISDIFDACRSLRSAVDSFDFSSDDSADRAFYEDNLSVIAGASRELEESDYNRNVTDFLENTYNRFPSSMFARLFSVKAPELFA